MVLAKVARRLAARKILSQPRLQYSINSAKATDGKVREASGEDKFQKISSATQQKIAVETPEDTPRFIFSGIQPTGIPHLGNYLGALRPWVELQQQSKKCDVNNFCVVDLHALTVHQDAARLSEWRKQSFASLLAVGLDPKKSNIFFQSDVPAHSELMWLLSTVASTGYLSRMTQWKSKLDLSENASVEDKASRAKLKLGLFSYPVLQAADILLYDTTHVPIGDDQVQHLEFTRSLANSFNVLFDGGDLFKIPRGIISPAKRIMSLTSPSKKMSKSDPDPGSRILITDGPHEVHAKIKAAVTDSEDGISYDRIKRPGISNLVGILKHTSLKSERPSDIAKQYQNMSKKAFKEMIADSVVASLQGIRENYETIISNPQKIYDAAAKGRGQARHITDAKLGRVREAMGIPRYYPDDINARRKEPDRPQK